MVSHHFFEKLIAVGLDWSFKDLFLGVLHYSFLSLVLKGKDTFSLGYGNPFHFL